MSENERKPVMGLPPYYVNICARARDLCEAITRQMASVKPDHNLIRLWCYELMMLNEMDRNLRYQEKQKVFTEDVSGRLHEI